MSVHMTKSDRATPLITIAIPTFNNEVTIGRAVDSCLAQTDAVDFEVLVADNASTDGTAEILANYGRDRRVRVIRNATTVTMYENHNICLRNASGRYVLFCHSDDALDIDAIAILKAHLQLRNYPNKYVCWGHSLFRDFSPQLSRYGIRTGQLFAGMFAAAPFLGSGLTPSGTCYSQDFIEHGGFISSSHGIPASDLNSMINVALKGFRFEMFQQMIFFRTDASTAITTMSAQDGLDAFCDSFSQLRHEIGDAKLGDLLKLADSSASPHYEFYYFLADIFPTAILRRMLEPAKRHPSVTTRKLFWRIVWKAAGATWKNRLLAK